MVKPYYIDQHVTVYNKSCTSIDELPDESVQMCVTSPPYWGLRKYAGEQDLIWGGENHHEHEWVSETRKQTGGLAHSLAYTKNQFVEATTNTCSLCGAWRGSFGLEPTPELYVAHSIEILREIKRVLRKDGVVFWNVGDSYAGSGGPGSQYDNKAANSFKGEFEKYHNPNRKITSCKPKDLCLIPFRVAIAAQEDGWWVRSVIIWNKPNPMPESVKDRPTESHEYILMLTKSANYYWNQEAVREPHETEPGPLRDKRNEGYGEAYFTPLGEGLRNGYHPNGRNIRSVWTFPTKGYPEAHFAVYPEELPERCIKAGSKEGDIVLDPFAGSGTTLWVSKRLGRKAVGYELSSEYCELIIKRNRQQVML